MGCFNLFFTLQALERHAGTISQGHRPSQPLTDVEVIVSLVMGWVLAELEAILGITLE